MLDGSFPWYLPAGSGLPYLLCLVCLDLSTLYILHTATFITLIKFVSCYYRIYTIILKGVVTVCTGNYQLMHSRVWDWGPQTCIIPCNAYMHTHDNCVHSIKHEPTKTFFFFLSINTIWNKRDQISILTKLRPNHSCFTNVRCS